MKPKTIIDIQTYNKSLEAKLEELEKRKQTLIKSSQKPATSPISTNQFTTQSLEYQYVQSNIDFKLIQEKLKIKEAQRTKLKEETELRYCSFRPLLNNKSNNYVKKMNYTPIQERKLTPKKQDKTQELAKSTTEELNPNKAKRKLNPEFSQKQLDWQNNTA